MGEGLFADITLPHGVFKPYASVKTHILFIDKSVKKQHENILFIEIKNDGYTQTDTRQPISGEQLSGAIKLINDFRSNEKSFIRNKDPISFLVEKELIRTDPKINLIGRMYDLQNRQPKKSDSKNICLGDVCIVKKGKSPNMKTQPGEYTMVVPAPEFKTADHFDFDHKAICIPLVSSSGHGKADIKRIHYVENKFALANTMCFLSVKDENLIIPKFLYYILSHKKDDLLVPLMKGATNVTLDPNDLLSLRVPCPDIEVQKQVINDLDSCNKLIKSIDVIYDSYFSDYKFDTSSLDKISLLDVCDFVRGVTYSKSDELEKDENAYKILRGHNIDKSFLNFNKMKFVKNSLNFKDAQKIKQNDILICTASGSVSQVGKVAFIDKDKDYYFGGFMGVLRVKNDLMPEYVFHVLNSREFKKHISDRLNGANINNLNKDILRDFKMHVPSEEIQKNLIEELGRESKSIEEMLLLKRKFKQNMHDICENISSGF